MSLRNTLRAMPLLLRVGVSGVLEYRLEHLLWTASNLMPLVMLAMWLAIARESPVVLQSGQAMSEGQLVVYFLCTFIVRSTTGAWASYQMNQEVRSGTLSMRLLRPVSPLWSYAAENLAVLPVKLAVTAPVAAGLVYFFAGGLSPNPAIWALWVLAMAGAWLLTFAVHIAVGSLGLFVDSSLRLIELWMILFVVFSGYLFPLGAFPPLLRRLADVLPFRFLIAFPVDLMTGALTPSEAVVLLAGQYLYIALFLGLATAAWRYGLRRFAAFGG